MQGPSSFVILQAQQIIISGTGVSGNGLFVYSGTPALGNPPQVAIVGSGVTQDPFNNTITSSKILIQANVITESGGIFRTAATAPLMQLDGPHNAFLIYDASVLRESIAPIATTDGLGANVRAGITAYQNNNVFIQLVAAAAGAFLQSQSGAGSTAPMQIRSVASGTGSEITVSTEQYPADGGAFQLNLFSPAAGGLMAWGGKALLIGALVQATAAALEVQGGDIDVATIGKGLRVAEGSNARQGIATLSSGIVLVPNTTITANTRIFLTVQTAGGTQGFLSTNRSVGVSFSIVSTSGSETSTVAWLLMEPG